MDNLLKKIITSFDKWEDYILPFLLTFFLNASIFGLYGENLLSVYNFASAVIILATFLYFEFFKKHHFIGGVLYIFIGLFCLIMMIRYIFYDDYGSGFQAWFLTAGERRAGQPNYFKALVSVFPFILSTIVYYFTVMLYRTSFLMLGSLIPCALYVKTLAAMSNFYLICIAGLNAAIFALNAGKKSTGTVKYGKNAGYISVLTLTAAAMFVSSLVPKQGEAKYYSVFEHYFMDSNSGRGGLSGRLGRRSGNAGYFRDLDETPLYDVSAEDLLYFRRQTFDLYSLEEHCWYPLDDYGTAYRTDDPNKSFGLRRDMNYDKMLAAMKKGAELDEALKNAVSPALLELEGTGDRVATAMIIPLNYSADFYLTTARTFEIKTGIINEDVGITRHLQIVRDSRLGKNAAYSVKYYKEFGSRDIWAMNGGANFTDEEYMAYTQRLCSVLSENGEEELAKAAAVFAADHIIAMEYKNACADNLSEIPEDIAEFARELTKEYKYDYQKAAVIQEYFQSGDYAYDLDYFPPEGKNTASYFIFTSKRGTCSDYATAFTLMARAAGLNVRYTEGFSPDLLPGDNSYRIRASGSHAYPEVYVQNMGWIVFEPTVLGAYSIGMNSTPSRNNTGIQIDTDILMTVVLTLCGIFGAAAVVIFAVPVVKYLMDAYKIRKGGKTAVLLIYRRVSAKYGKKFGIRAETLTPSELADGISEKLAFDIGGFTEIYEAVCFGGLSPDDGQSNLCRQTYDNFKKALKHKQPRQLKIEN